MKKFVNDPKQFVPEMLKGIALANPDTHQVRAGVQPDHAGRRAQQQQGQHRPGLRLRPRAGPRHGGRPRHARRRLPRRRVRRPAVGLRLPDRQAARVRQGRPAAGQQLHRRPDGVRDGPGAGRGRRPQGDDPVHRRRRRGEGLHLDGRPPRRGRQLLRHEGRAGPRPRRAPSSRRSYASARRSTRSPAPWASR